MDADPSRGATGSPRVQLVRGLEEGLGDAIAFLDDGARVATPASLFAPSVVVVPSIGVREWLAEQLALRLGATGARDGIAANVDFRFPAVLDHFMPGRPEEDPWSVPAMTSALLRLCDAEPWRGLLAPRIEAVGGPLRFASRLADRFDRYHARRPAMIRLWETGAWALAPEEPAAGGEILAAELTEHDRWQFDLWRDLRIEIGVPSLPARLAGELAAPSAEVRASLPPRLLVFGFSSLGQHQVEVISAIARFSEVSVVFVHPSPLLASRWAEAPVARNADALPRRTVEAIPDDLASSVLPLAHGWLRTSREAQRLLARAGVAVAPHRVADVPTAPSTVLAALQRAIAEGTAARQSYGASDESLVLHRCHGPARQAEVAFDAIVQALQDDPSLHPHDIAIVSPDIERMAPYLRATFGRAYVDSEGRTCRIPLSVGDRSLQRVDDGARVFVAFLEVASGRMDSASVQALLGDPALLESNRILDPDLWWQWIFAADQRWGVDARHRDRHDVGIVRDDGEPEQRHTWLHTLRRLVVGAVSGTGREPSVAGTVPLPDVEVDELPEALRLASLVGAIVALVEATGDLRTPAQWAVAIEDAFVGLCGDDSDLLSSPLATLAELAEIGDEVPVPFADAAAFLVARCDGVPDSRFSRFGGVVATSVASVRLVPYRVLCLVGVDDDALGGGESEGDDLISRQQLLGDPDARLEHRRALLDAVVSASDRLIICCNGRSLKNNDPVPLPTPLAELLDACRAAGAAPSGAVDGPLALEVEHPRHSLSARNFREGGVVPGRTWSHAADARDIAARIAVARVDDSVPTWQPVDVRGPLRATVRQLVDALESPLSTFLDRTLKIDWSDRKDAIGVADPSDVPLVMDDTAWAAAARDCYVAGGSGRDEWRRSLVASGALPVTIGAASLAQSGLEDAAASLEGALPRRAWQQVEEQRMVEVVCADGSVVEATVPPVVEVLEEILLREGEGWRHVLAEGSRWLFDPTFLTKKPSSRQVSRLYLSLLAATASGIDAQGVLVPAPYDKGPVILHRFAFADRVTRDDARELFGTLIGLLRWAASTPIPNFDGLARKWAMCASAEPPKDEERADLRTKIAEFKDPPRGLTAGRRDELLVFGDEADIESVAPGLRIMHDYWTTRERWWPEPSRSGNGMGKVRMKPYVLVELRLPSAPEEPR